MLTAEDVKASSMCTVDATEVNLVKSRIVTLSCQQEISFFVKFI
jgi:hypothetical protein